MEESKLLQRGTPVRVRCADGRYADDVVWEDFGDVVMVCGPDQYARLTGGYGAPMPIGFRREDVLPAVPA
jgi:hypothetical protein